MIPGIIGGGLMQINILIDQSIASFLEEGAISILAFADRINQLPLALIGTAIGTVLLPTLSRQLKTGAYDDAQITQNRAMEIALFFSLPACFALIFIAKPIIFTLFEHGAFTKEASEATANTLAAFALGLPAFVMIKVLTPCFFAKFDTKTPVKISIICLVVNVLLNIVFIQFLSYVGIALATSLASWLNAGILFYILNKNKIFIPDKRLLRNTPRMFMACAMMVGTILMLKLQLIEGLYHQSNFLRTQNLLILIAAGMISFFVSSYMMKIISVQELRLLLRRKK
jgi:putative peptidoglycan lipid II flippase